MLYKHEFFVLRALIKKLKGFFYVFETTKIICYFLEFFPTYDALSFQCFIVHIVGWDSCVRKSIVLTLYEGSLFCIYNKYHGEDR